MEKQSRDYYRDAGSGRRTKAHIVFGLFCLLLTLVMLALLVGLCDFYSSLP